MCSTFLPILLVFASPEGYRLVFHSMCTFCVYRMALYWQTPQFYLCMYISFDCRNVAAPGELLQHSIIFHQWVWYCTLSRRVFDKIKVRASSSSPRLPSCYIQFFCSLHCWASQCRKISYSITHPTSLLDALGTIAWASEHYFKAVSAGGNRDYENASNAVR